MSSYILLTAVKKKGPQEEHAENPFIINNPIVGHRHHYFLKFILCCKTQRLTRRCPPHLYWTQFIFGGSYVVGEYTPDGLKMLYITNSWGHHWSGKVPHWSGKVQKIAGDHFQENTKWKIDIEAQHCHVTLLVLYWI